MMFIVPELTRFVMNTTPLIIGILLIQNGLANTCPVTV